MKYCKDCKHFKRDFPFFWELDFARCAMGIKKNFMGSEYLSPAKNLSFLPAWMSRKNGPCYPEAKLFEPKRKP